MPKVIVHTQAYNAEKTLRRAIESILNQTYTDFTYIILDNGSTDSTGEIIAEYAKRDRRVIARYEKVNNRHRYLDMALECAAKYQDGYYAMLDADDEYLPEFIEKTLAYAQAHNLDIAACGSRYTHLDRVTEKDYLVTKNDIVFDLESSDEEFVEYFKFMFTNWNKLFSLDTLRKCKFENISEMFVNDDTAFSTEIFGHATRFGALSKSLHVYHLQPSSWYSEFNPRRFESHQLAYNVLIGYLCLRKISTNQNIYMALFTYADWMRFSTTLLKNALVSEDMLITLRDAFAYQYTQTLFESHLDPWVELQHLLEPTQRNVQEYVAALPKAPEGDAFQYAVDIFVSMKNIYVTPSWDPANTFLLLVSVRLRRKDAGEQKVLDDSIVKLITKYPLLEGMSASAAVFMCDAVLNIIDEDLSAALANILGMLVSEVPDDCVEELLMLAQNLAAVTDSSDAFVYLKKIWISHLLDNGRLGEATTEINEFLELLPNDEDFIALKATLLGGGLVS